MKATDSATPVLSVVMPTRNQAGFIAQAVHSVMSQGIEGLELWVQDGASSDGTQALLAALAERHPGLRWASAPDHGPAEALNRAIAQVRAPVLGWLNSDDLYLPGAAARALAHLQAHPERVLVWGEAEHIDGAGAVLGRYPTRGPQTALADWADGCHICQPTVFMRRDALLAAGPLDEGLRTAFDYELWLRLLKAYPNRAGMVAEVQAQSRLHAQAITLRLREHVAMEALQLIHRHIGPAPAHWLLTHVDEVIAGLPIAGAAETPVLHLLRLVNRAEAWLSSSARADLRSHIARHRGLHLASASSYATVHADGWAPPRLQLRLRGGAGTLRLCGHHAAPGGGALHLRIEQPGAAERRQTVPAPGPFTLELQIGTPPPDEMPCATVACDNPFVPALTEPGSTDRRELAFVLEAMDWRPHA